MVYSVLYYWFIDWCLEVLSMTDKRFEEIDKLTGFELNVLKLLHCIATMKRGHTYEQIVYLNLLEQLCFPEKED